MRKINKYQTTELFNNDSEKLNGYKNFIALTKDDNIIHLKKVIKKISDVIYINQLESDPTKMITGDINGEIIQWIRQNSHRVLAKKTGEGTVTYIELDDDNSNLYAADGTAAATDGTEGDVFVKLPTFYYRGNDNGPDGSSGDNVEIKFSKEPFDDCVEWDSNTLIGAYEAYYGDGKLQSCSGIASSGNISQSNFKSYAQSRGKGYQLVDWQMHCVLGCLFYAMYGNTNSQAICGSGTNSFKKVCGETNSSGMNDTKAETNGNIMSINFWGLENWWGNKAEFMQEDNIGKVMTTYDPITKGTRTIDVPSYNSYVKRMVFGKYMDLIPKSDNSQNGNESTGYCDYQNWDNTLTNRVVWRSNNNVNASGGVSYSYASSDTSIMTPVIGSRLAFRGVASKADSVEAFKALPVL